MIMIALFANVAWGVCFSYDDCMSLCKKAYPNDAAACKCYETTNDRISYHGATTLTHI